MRWARVALVTALFAHCSGAGADGPTASAPDGTFNGARRSIEEQLLQSDRFISIACSSKPLASKAAHYVTTVL
jgi:hypothetical protein